MGESPGWARCACSSASVRQKSPQPQLQSHPATQLYYQRTEPAGSPLPPFLSIALQVIRRLSPAGFIQSGVEEETGVLEVLLLSRLAQSSNQSQLQLWLPPPFFSVVQRVIRRLSWPAREQYRRHSCLFPHPALNEAGRLSLLIIHSATVGKKRRGGSRSCSCERLED